MDRFKAKAGEIWRTCQSVTEEDLLDNWQNYLRGCRGFYQLTEVRKPVFELEPWIRRHIRKYFWWRWHGPDGRRRNLRSLGLKGHC